MGKKLFGSPDESAKEDLKTRNSGTETQKAPAGAGVKELSIEMMEGVSGGNQSVPPEWMMRDE